MTSGYYSGKTAPVKTGNARPDAAPGRGWSQTAKLWLQAANTRIIQSLGFLFFPTMPVKKSSIKKPVGKARTHISLNSQTTNSASSMPVMNFGAGITMETANPSMIRRGNQYLHLVHMF